MDRAERTATATRTPVDQAPPLPEEPLVLLGEALGDTPCRLYLVEPDDALVVAWEQGLPSMGEAWELELTAIEPWLRAPSGVLTDLSDSLPQAERRSLYLYPLRCGGRLAGGLLLDLPDPETRAELLTRLAEPPMAAHLGLLVRYLASRAETALLRAFRGAVDAALPYGFLGIDSVGRVTFMGGQAEQILGVSESEARGKDCARIFRPVGIAPNPLLEGLRGPRASMELYLARPEGGEVPISLQMSPLAIAGDGGGLVAFFQDLSEERSLEEAERQKDRLAVLGELSAGVAHEIRNPLTGIANCAQVLREDLEDDYSGQRFLGIILDEVARLNRIVEGLLNYARPNRPEMREGDLETCIRRALELTEAERTEKGIRTRLEIRGRIPPVFFDGAQVEQVLLNLIRNADQAMPGGGELRVDVGMIKRLPHRRRGPGRRSSDLVRRSTDPPTRQRFVEIKIQDTGSGIPEAILPRIWNPFFTTRSKGTGLGLSLCQSIVREHGGFLTIRSVEKKGTTVLLELPVERRHGERRKRSD